MNLRYIILPCIPSRDCNSSLFVLERNRKGGSSELDNTIFLSFLSKSFLLSLYLSLLGNMSGKVDEDVGSPPYAPAPGPGVV